jgi:uncharacterized protein (TIGR02145 family)
MQRTEGSTMKTRHTTRNAICVVAFLLSGLLAATAFSEDSNTTSEKKSGDATSKQFKAVTIGSQEWMAANLDVATFRNGDTIPEAKTTEQWLAAGRSESPAWCYYKNDPKNGKKFGKLYNWYAVNDPRGIAPAGWHVPTDGEWQTLITFYGGTGAAFSKLKSADGLAALAAGARYYKDASFNHMGNITFWWSASKNDKWNAWYHAMHFGDKQVARDNGGMNTGHSVRCVKDKSEAKDTSK